MTRRIRLINALIRFHLKQDGPLEMAVVPESTAKICQSLTERALRTPKHGKKSKNGSAKGAQIQAHQFEITGFEKGSTNDTDAIRRHGAT